ncbi:unnamed protein product [Clonostachys rosea]|uniref:AA1-like domain-containing protein n=1 Tax=Bionectria ochroleuca TaxID=29856 RepID=A0ABY6UYE3_BIOOC|nr:unnamed protein product [Clonostachys rosea]
MRFILPSLALFISFAVAQIATFDVGALNVGTLHVTNLLIHQTEDARDRSTTVHSVSFDLNGYQIFDMHCDGVPDIFPSNFVKCTADQAEPRLLRFVIHEGNTGHQFGLSIYYDDTEDNIFVKGVADIPTNCVFDRNIKWDYRYNCTQIAPISMILQPQFSDVDYNYE